MIKIYSKLRANKEMSATYIKNKLEEFTPLYCAKFKDKDIEHIEFCKQDIRGCLSISIGTASGCISHQQFFMTEAELMAFVEGFLFCNSERV